MCKIEIVTFFVQNRRKVCIHWYGCSKRGIDVYVREILKVRGGTNTKYFLNLQEQYYDCS